jgi:trans-4-hydroxy-L-proline dehydratase
LVHRLVLHVITVNDRRKTGIVWYTADTGALMDTTVTNYSKPFITEHISSRVRSLRERLYGRQLVEGMEPPLACDPVGANQFDKAAKPVGEPFHDAWMAHSQSSFDLRLAHALASWWASTPPRLDSEHLVQGTWPVDVTIAFQTGRPGWDFYLDEQHAADDEIGRGILAYWREYLRNRPAIERPRALGLPGFADAVGITGKFCHSSQAYDLAIEYGIDGLKRRVREHSQGRLDESDWYQALEVTLDGVAGYILAHARAADLRGGEWHVFAENCRHIAKHPPATFHQAVQLFYFLFLLNRHDSPGRIDQYLWPALHRDLDSGSIELEDAQEIVDCLYLRFAEHVCYGSTIGGQLHGGGDATNTLTWLCLNSIRRLRLLSPRTALRVHRNTPTDLYSETVRSLASGATFPTLVNDDAMIPAMLRRGATAEHARDYTFAGCGQVIPQGRAHGSYEDVILSGVKPLTYALHDGRDERTAEQIGPRSGSAETMASYEELEEAVWTQFVFLIESGIEATNAIRRWSATHLRDFLRSVLTHSCLENGRDWRAGGADYHDGMVDIVGLTTLTDSLLAIRHVVFEEGRLSLSEFVNVLDRNWDGNESLRSYCLNQVPKFGNENSEADGLLRRWLVRINDWLLTRKTEFGGRWGMDIIGWSGAVSYGKVAGATPDGRFAGEPLADCAGPAQGRDRFGITAVLNSMLELPNSEIHGPLALNLRLPRASVDTPRNREKLEALLGSYFERGGQQVQVTIAGVEEMRAAQKEPELHRDLMVRVGGFSAYFVELTAEYQEDMIRRTEHAV